MITYGNRHNIINYRWDINNFVDILSDRTEEDRSDIIPVADTITYQYHQAAAQAGRRQTGVPRWQDISFSGYDL